MTERVLETELAAIVQRLQTENHGLRTALECLQSAPEYYAGLASPVEAGPAEPDYPELRAAVLEWAAAREAAHAVGFASARGLAYDLEALEAARRFGASVERLAALAARLEELR
jgi:hypothetical protein